MEIITLKLVMSNEPKKPMLLNLYQSTVDRIKAVSLDIALMPNYQIWRSNDTK
jgi:hypothetical protein